jgi:asparagine synthase (glutamine-hydrolysing)
MCGIVGHITTNGIPPNREGVLRATEQLRHRGPDDSGLKCYSTACFGHRRLSIIDLAHSHQPFSSQDERYCLVFNGEIYNYLELRRELEKQGHRFITDGDTEVLLRAYIQYGPQCLTYFNGMFAFAIWDEHEQSLFLARDRLGKKPLYYADNAAGLFFASEIEALRHFSQIDLSLDLYAVHDYFAYQFIPFPRSIYQDIRKLAPAHYLRYHNGKSQLHRYWAPPLPTNNLITEHHAIAELMELVDDAVRLRLRSDVPIGTFLSGGIDSTLIVATLVKLGVDLDTFTEGFTDASFDESSAARATANFFNTRHHEEDIDLDLAALIKECVMAFGEPFADPSALPTWYLCRHTKRFATVALSGDGGDELFGGYRRYYAAQFIAHYRKLPRFLRTHVIERLVNLLHEGEGYYATSIIKKLKLFLHMAKRLDESPNDFLPQTFSPSERQVLLAQPGFLSSGMTDEVITENLSHLTPLSLCEQMMQADIHAYLSEDILTKVDRMSMVHGLEVRAPLLDYRVVEFACRLPLKLKIQKGLQKYILRKAYTDKLPAEVIKRPKHGFSVPLARAFKRKQLGILFQNYVFDSSTDFDIINRKEINKLWSEHQKNNADNSFKLWSLLVFFIWSNEFKFQR